MKKLFLCGILSMILLSACTNAPKGDVNKKTTETKAVTTQTKPVVTETKAVVVETKKPVVTETKPVVVETKKSVATETKPVVVETKKPVVTETKPVITETKVVTETKPVTETKVVTEIKPVVVETKPVVTVTKPVIVETKPVVTETKPVVVTTYTDLSVKDASNFITATPGIIIVDVSALYSKGHLPAALNASVADGTFDKALLKWNKDKTFLIYSHNDDTSMLAAKKLIDAGFKKVYRLKGNYSAWVDAKLAVEITK